jgi:hypothetical protein
MRPCMSLAWVALWCWLWPRLQGRRCTRAVRLLRLRQSTIAMCKSNVQYVTTAEHFWGFVPGRQTSAPPSSGGRSQTRLRHALGEVEGLTTPYRHFRVHQHGHDSSSDTHVMSSPTHMDPRVDGRMTSGSSKSIQHSCMCLYEVGFELGCHRPRAVLA